MFVSERKFRMWDYRVSHNQLLIRSPQTPDISTNVDIVFWGVDRVDLPTAFNGLELIKRGEEDFSIGTDSGEYSILASGCKVLENELDIFESSLESFASSEAEKDLGNVLAQS